MYLIMDHWILGCTPFLDNSRMPEDCHPTWKIGGLWWTGGFPGRFVCVLAPVIQGALLFKARSGTSGAWQLGTWDPPGAHYVPLVCRPGTDSATFHPKILWHVESR